MANWSYIALPCAPNVSSGQREITEAHARHVTWRVDDAATATFTIDGRSNELTGIVPLASDLIIRRNGVKMFRGRIAPAGDDVDETVHQTQLGAWDYRKMLDTRMIGTTGRSFSNTDQAVIAWTVIAESQALSGGNWGVTNGLGSTSTQPRDNNMDPGEPLGKVIGDMGRMDGGYEWEISEELVFNRWYPTRGAVTGKVIDFGGVASKVKRTFDPTIFANAAMATGAETTVPVLVTDAGIATDPRGRWELQRGYTIELQDSLNDRAIWLEGQTSVIKPAFSVQLAPERWGGKSDIWLGDVVKLQVESGWMAVDAPYRVVEIDIAIDDDGGETVTFGMVGV